MAWDLSKLDVSAVCEGHLDSRNRSFNQALATLVSRVRDRLKRRYIVGVNGNSASSSQYYTR